MGAVEEAKKSFARGWNLFGVLSRVEKLAGLLWQFLVWLAPPAASYLMARYAETYSLPTPVLVTLAIGVFVSTFAMVLLYKLTRDLNRQRLNDRLAVNDLAGMVKQIGALSWFESQRRFFVALKKDEATRWANLAKQYKIANNGRGKAMARGHWEEGLSEAQSAISVRLELSLDLRAHPHFTQNPGKRVPDEDTNVFDDDAQRFELRRLYDMQRSAEQCIDAAILHCEQKVRAHTVTVQLYGGGHPQGDVTFDR